MSKSMLAWEKPKFVRSTDWNLMFQNLQWVGMGDSEITPLIKKTARNALHVELRRNFPQAQFMAIVALDGWNFNHEKRDPDRHWGSSTRGYTVRFSSNASCWGHSYDLHEIAHAVDEAYLILTHLQPHFPEPPAVVQP